jgi:hypothetical protein
MTVKIRTTVGTKTKASLYYEFSFALFSQLGSISQADINGCLPDTWKSEVIVEDKDYKNIQQNFAGQYPKLSNILGYLGKAIDYCCNPGKIKDDLIKFLVSKVKRRLFLESQGKTGRGILGDIGGFLTSAKNEIEDSAKKIKEGTIKIANDVIDTTKDVVKQITAVIKDKFAPAFDIFNAVKAEWEAFNKLPIIVLLKWMYDCFKKAQKFANNIVKLYGAWVTFAATIATPAGWVKFGTCMICAWATLLKIVNYLKDGVASDGVKRWQNYGNFLGLLIKTVGNC